MDIWLIHTFFAYYYFSDFIYGFRFDILIFLVCMAFSVFASMMVQVTWDSLLRLVRK